MTNDKRIILAIALYAAVIIMVLHTLDTEGHERIATTQSFEISSNCHSTTPLQLTSSICTEVSCTPQEMVLMQSEPNLGNEETAGLKDGEANEQSDPS